MVYKYYYHFYLDYDILYGYILNKFYYCRLLMHSLHFLLNYLHISLFLSALLSSFILFSSNQHTSKFIHHDYDFILNEWIPSDDNESSGTPNNNWQIYLLESASKIGFCQLNNKTKFYTYNRSCPKPYTSLQFHPRI